VLVISPASNESKVAFWVSDSDEAIEEAETAQVDTVERLEDESLADAESRFGVPVTHALISR
jgi:hypothetical protein